MSTTKSTISSNNFYVRDILIDFLDNLYTFREFRERIKEFILLDFDLDSNRREINLLASLESIQIQVEAKHLENVLRSYLDSKISTEDLSNWAAIIYMIPAYVPMTQTNTGDEESDDNPLWDILQTIADPSTLKIMNFEVAESYLKLL